MSTMTQPRPRSGGWIMPLILVGMVALPFLEVYLIVQVGQLIGVWWTLGILIGEALLGAFLMRREGGRAWKALNQAFASGKMPAGELADTALILVGGVLLVVPGFATDVIGLLFLLPFTRPLARKVLAYAVARRMSRLGMPTGYAAARRLGDRGRDRARHFLQVRPDNRRGRWCRGTGGHRRRDRGRPRSVALRSRVSGGPSSFRCPHRPPRPAPETRLAPGPAGPGAR